MLTLIATDIALGDYDDAYDRDRARIVGRLTQRMQYRAGGCYAAALPAARIVHVAARPSTRVVVVKCPFAASHDSQRAGHEFHVHGWPYGSAEPGTRVPHCDNAPDGFYRLTVAPDIEIPTVPGATATVRNPEARLGRFIRRHLQ